MGRWKRDENHSPHKNKVIQDLEQNEENRYADPDSNKTKINNTKEPYEAHKNTQKGEILQKWEFHRDDTRHHQPKCTGGTQSIPRQQNQEYEKTQKKINEIIEGLNKHQTETKTP
jgi:hypothetical protein